MAGRSPLGPLAALTLALAACGYDSGRPDAGRPGPPGLPGPAIDAGRGVPGLIPDGAPGGGDPSSAPACSNGIDDDCDGLIDFPADPGCASPEDDNERGPGLVCDDGIDNDNDGVADYVVPGCGQVGDPGCSSVTDPTEVDTPGPF
jgi:hypothetical protein